MYNDFLASKPSYQSLLFIHEWYDKERFKKDKDLNPKKVSEISLNKYQTAMLNYAENLIRRHRCGVRVKTIDEINTRLFKSNYQDKLNYLDF